MAAKFFTGKAKAVAQVDTVQITADDAATTYTITIGGVSVSVAGSGTGVNDTAAALKVALAAETHPYFAAITWTVATDTITATANTAGCPFTATSSKSGGTGTIGAVTSSVACTGPNFYNVGENWSDGSVPGASDDVHVDSNLNVCWGLDASAVTLTSFTAWRNSGKIGLRHDKFATTADGDTYSAIQVPEYRETYLKIKVNGPVTIGKYEGPRVVNGSGRVKIDLGAQAAMVQVDYAETAADIGPPSVRMLANSASTDVYVRSAEGGFGLAVDQHDETTTIRDIAVSDESSNSRVSLGRGVTLTSWKQRGGENLLQAAATVATVDNDGGVLTSDGDFTVTAWNNNGGTAYPNHKKTGGNAITTANNNAGTMDTTRSSEPRTWNDYKPRAGAILKYDKDVLTITTGDPQIQDPGPQTVGIGGGAVTP